MRYRVFLFGVTLAALTAAKVCAHGSSELRLQELDNKIQIQPSANNFIRRGRVHFDSEHWQLALADFKRASNFSPVVAEAFFWLAEVYRKINQPDLATQELKTYLTLQPNSPLGHWRLADLYAAERDFSNAEQHYRAAIAFDNNPPPQLFQDRINNLIAQQPQSREAIAAAIESALRQHPVTITLVEQVLDYYENQGDYSNAIDLLDNQPQATKQAPKWLLRKAQWQIKKGDVTGAEQSLNSVLNKIDAIPTHRKKLEIFQKIRLSALLLLEAL